MQAPTNGFFYVLDRETGELISAEKIGQVTWPDHIDLKTGRPVEAPNLRYETGEVTIFPGSLVPHTFQPMCNHQRNGLLHIPYQQLSWRPITGGTPAPAPTTLQRLPLYNDRHTPN